MTKYHFHDQGVTGISLKNGQLNLGVESYNEDTKTYVPTSVVFSDVSEMKIDDVVSEAVEPMYDDGEIIHFKTKDNSTLLIIQWIDYKNKKESTKSYKFNFQQMKVDGK